MNSTKNKLNSEIIFIFIGIQTEAKKKKKEDEMSLILFWPELPKFSILVPWSVQ